MEFNTIKNHPDFVEALKIMAKESSKHNRNQKIAGSFVAVGSGLMTFGVILYKVEEQRLKRAR